MAVRVKAGEYRGRDGFTVSSGARPWGSCIFVQTRQGAEIVRAALKLPSEKRGAQDKIIDGVLMAGW